jgi:hypothetical protein
MIHTTLPLSYIGTYEDAIKLGYGIGIPSDRYIYRDDILDSIHHGRSPEYHPDKSYLIKNKNLNLILSGSWEFEWSWEEGDFTEEQIDTFMAEPLIQPNATILKDFANNKVTINVSNADIEMDSWGVYRQSWVLASKTAKITSKSNNGCILCIALLNNSFDSYNVESRTIEPGTATTIEKVGSEVCYFLLSSDLTKDGNTLEPFKMYKLTSDSISVANTGVDRTRIIRISK